MKFTLEIKLGNDAMQTPADIADALQDLAGDLKDAPDIEPTPSAGTIRDINGNRIGHWQVS